MSEKDLLKSAAESVGPGAKVPSEMLAAVEYEHRRAGKLVSRGRQRIDRHRRIHYIQEDEKGRRLGEVICDREGAVLEVIEGDSRLSAKFKDFVASFVKSPLGRKG